MINGFKRNAAGFMVFCVLSGAAVVLGAEDHHQHHMHMMQPVAQPVVDMETAPAEPVAGKPATVTFTLKDDKGSPLKDMVITHERILHVVIISQDLSYFAHIHPEDFGTVDDKMKSGAVFPVRYTFPEAGKYLVAVDFAVGENFFSEHFSVDVQGSPAAGVMKKDFAWKKDFGPYRVSLTTSPEAPVAGKETVLTYEVSRDGKSVKDLEPYLGAPMHLAVVPVDLSGFTHTHGEIPGAGGGMTMGHLHGAMVKGPFGPDIEARVIFPKEGIYKIFGELKHQGRVILTEFMLKVE